MNSADIKTTKPAAGADTHSLVLAMMGTLGQAGKSSFRVENTWEPCLCALVLALNPGIKTNRVLESLPCHSRPYDLLDVLNMVSHLGYYARRVRVNSFRGVDKRLLPCLFVPDAGTPFVISRRPGRRGLGLYPRQHRRIKDDPGQPGYMWIFEPYDENRAATSKFMRNGSTYSWFRALVGRFRPSFMHIALVGFLMSLASLITPVFIMIVYDRVVASGLIGTLPMLAAGAFAAIALEWGLRHVRTNGMAWVAGRLDNIVGNRIFSHLIGLNPGMIERASVSSQIARIKTFESVRDFFSSSMFQQLLDLPFIVISLIAIAFIAGPLVFVPLAMVLAYIGLFAAVREKVKTSIRLAAKASSARQQFTIETFDKIDCIREHGLQKKWQDKFSHMTGREMMAMFRLGWLGIVAETAAHTLTVLAAILTVSFGAQLIWAGQMSTGGLVATMILVWRVLTPFYSLCTMIPRLEQLRNSIIQINALMDIDTEAEEARSMARLPVIKGNISFTGVAMRYSEDSDPVFTGLSFDAAPGDMVAVTGANGTGKSTILKLAEGLYRPQIGTVRIDGFDIRQLDVRDLRRQVAYVSQAPYFFRASIEENLRFVHPLAGAGDIQKALEMADLWKDIESLPGGLQTEIASHGRTALTSSVASRLSLARAYLHPGNVLLIDELPNSLLSGAAGKNLRNYLVRARGKRTAVMVTYRDDFMKLADTVVVLRGAALPVAGPRESVLGKVIPLNNKEVA